MVGILMVRYEGTNDLHTLLVNYAFRPVASITHLAVNVVVHLKWLCVVVAGVIGNGAA